MKQFNLEEYLANPNRKIVTRNGRNARIICHDAKGSCPVIALVACENYEGAFNATKDGKIDGVLDLFFASEKHEGWINVYRNREHLWCGDIKRTETEAKEFKDSEFYITSIKIEWEE